MTQWGKTCKRLEQASHRKGDTQAQSCLTLFESRHCSRDRLLCPWDSPGKNTGVGRLSLLQGIFPAQGLNPSILHCREILHHLSQKGSPRLPWPNSNTITSAKTSLTQPEALHPHSVHPCPFCTIPILFSPSYYHVPVLCPLQDCRLPNARRRPGESPALRASTSFLVIHVISQSNST